MAFRKMRRSMQTQSQSRYRSACTLLLTRVASSSCSFHRHIL